VLKKLSAKANWARIICLVACLVQIVHDIYHFQSHFGIENMTVIIISFVNNLLQVILNGYAFYLLLTPQAKDWVKADKLPGLS
jgi:hypothetical protein